MWRRLITLIYAGWLPHDLAASRSCLSLKSEVRQRPYSSSTIEGSPERDRASVSDRRILWCFRGSLQCTTANFVGCLSSGISAWSQPSILLQREWAQGESSSEPAAESTAVLHPGPHSVKNHALRIGLSSLAIAHMKAASSRAIAVITVLRFLPLAVSLLNLSQSRTCAFQAILRTSSGNPANRARRTRLSRAGWL